MIDLILKNARNSLSLTPEVLEALKRLPRQLLEIYRILCRLRSRPRKAKRGARHECDDEVDLPSDVYKRADPMLYSQTFLMKMGVAVTWDNPDIQLFEVGVPISSSKLQPDVEYEVAVRIWNNSYDAPAIGLPVYLSFLSFGVATAETMVGKTFTDLGAKGTSQCPAFAKFKWRTPALEGHYCLLARLDWPDDANPENNVGQENTDVARLQSPAQFEFKVRNKAAIRRRFRYVVDDYQLPKLEVCPPEDDRSPRFASRLAESQARWERVRREQGFGQHQNLEDWNIAILPPSEVIGPLEEIEVRVSIEPKFAFKGSKPFNINVFSLSEEGEAFEGGVTLTVQA
jgi:hypothetical protein